MIRSFAASQFTASQLVAAKRGRTISVCLPARDEAATIGPIVTAIREQLMERFPVVDELVVIDDGSSDQSATIAAAAGATVVAAASVLPEYGTEQGKGQALWRGVHSTTGDIVAFCDTDLRAFATDFILGLVGPLLAHDELAFVKGYYERPIDGRVGEGGRVTELMARPLIALLFPHLNPIRQPLAGEYAARRDVLEAVPFAGGYAVDLGLLIDVADRYGVAALAQSDLGVRVHRNRPLAELGAQATSVLQVALARAGQAEAAPSPWGSVLHQPGIEPKTITYSERPPLAEVAAHRRSA